MVFLHGCLLCREFVYGAGLIHVFSAVGFALSRPSGPKGFGDATLEPSGYWKIWRFAQSQQNKDVSSKARCSGLQSGEKKYYLRLRDLYDPDNRYSGLAQLGDTKVDSPDVRNEHGVEVLNVGEYMTKLQDGDVVEVEVILKLWNIRLPKDALPNSRDANGSRAYQLILRHTQLLPCAAYTKKSLHNSKGKRKATDELEGQSPAKNSKICDIFDIEMETDDE